MTPAPGDPSETTAPASTAAPPRGGWPPLLDHLAGLVVLVAVWHFGVTLAGTPPYLLPAPAAVGAAILDLARTGALWSHFAFTVGNIVLGLALGGLAGFAVGFGLARSRTAERWLEGPIVLLQTAPKIALAPLFVIWFGFGSTSKVVLIVSLVFFPVMVATLVGLRSVPTELRDLAALLRLDPWQRLSRIEVPSAIPEIFAGLRVGAVQAVVGAILGEWMSGKVGLGYLMTFATATYKTPLLFAAVLLTVCVGVVVHVGLGAVENRLLRWKP